MYIYILLLTVDTYHPTPKSPIEFPCSTLSSEKKIFPSSPTTSPLLLSFTINCDSPMRPYIFIIFRLCIPINNDQPTSCLLIS